jgi:predicted nucleotidyltransferase
MHKTIHTILAELRGRFEVLYGSRLVQMVLYGSQARDDATPDSDIDVLVVLQGSVQPSAEIRRTGGIVADLSLRYGVVIACVFMDEAQFRHGQEPLLRNVRREGIAV